MAKKSVTENVQLSYNDDADVLYISFDSPQPADDADLTDEGVVVRLRSGKIVGLTILNASHRLW